jgi:hypothetical protein
MSNSRRLNLWEDDGWLLSGDSGKNEFLTNIFAELTLLIL